MDRLSKIAYWLVLLMPISIMLEPRILGTINNSFIVIVGLIYLYTDKKRKYINEPWFKAFVILFLYMLLRSFFAPSIFSSLWLSLLFGCFVFIPLVMQFLIKHEGIHKKLVYIFICILAFFLIEGYSEYFTGKSLILRTPLHIDPGEYNRIAAPNGELIYGEIISRTIGPIAALGIFYLIGKTRLSYAYLFIVLASFIAVILSGERAALITFCLGLTILILVTYNRSILSYKGMLYTLIIAALVSALSISIFRNSSKILNRQVHSVIEIAKNYNNSIYGKLWITGLKIGAEHPIFGVGGNQFRKYSCKYLDQETCKLHKRPHSIYVEFFSEFGIIGLGLFTLFVCSVLKRIVIFYLKSDANRLSKFLLLGITISILQPLWPLPIYSIYRSWIAFPFFFMIGWALCIIQNHENKRNNSASA